MLRRAGIVAGIMNITFDTNCIIALEENEQPAARHLRCIVQVPTNQELRLRVAGISASERQRRGKLFENFRAFEAKLARAGLENAEILLPPMIWDMTYWDNAIWGSERFAEEAERIHQILSPTTPFEYEDYCRRVSCAPVAPDLDRKWRNCVIDTWALWSHCHYGGGVFVTSDENFHRPAKKAALAQLGAGEILRPREAAARFCPTCPAVAPLGSGN